jgi:hypothetical protein
MRPFAASCPRLSPAVLLAVSVLSLAPAPDVRAGVRIDFEHRSPATAPAASGSAWIEADRLRTEADGQVMIFRADLRGGLVWAWSAGKKEYMELTRAQAEQMGGMMAEMEKQLAALSPEERAMAQQMMGAQMGAAAGRYGTNANAPAALPAPMKVTPLGKTETIHGFACSAQEVRRGATVEGEYWITGWEQFHLAPADFGVFEKLAAFLRDATGGMAAAPKDALAQLRGADGLAGVPVRVITPERGGGTSVHDITKLEKQDIAASQFELPPGMTKQSMDMGGRGRR